MVQNIIFDMGNVLRRFDPYECIRPYVTNKKSIDLIYHALFHEAWADLDRGVTTYEQVLEACKEKLPAHLHEPTALILDNWHHYMPIDPDMLCLVKQLKSQGYKLYLLSNASMRFYAYQKEEEIFDYFDGFVVSGFLQTVKPEEKIYIILLDTYHLVPSQCFFIDDMPHNIATGALLGMKTHLYDGDKPKLMQALAQEGIFV